MDGLNICTREARQCMLMAPNEDHDGFSSRISVYFAIDTYTERGLSSNADGKLVIQPWGFPIIRKSPVRLVFSGRGYS